MMPKFSCLIIDDDCDDREIFGIALEESGESCSLIEAENGVKGLELLASEASIPDYIFLDLNMPLLSGKECLREIRKREHLKDVPVIIYSTSSYYKDKEDTRIMGATNFLTKTPDIKRLSELLSDIFTGRKLSFELT